MSEKAFNKKLQKCCEYCVHGTVSSYGEEVLCVKKGITNYRDCCRSYKYDPLKRNPLRAKISDNYTPDDFKL